MRLRSKSIGSTAVDSLSMFSRSLQILMIAGVILAGSVSCFTQTADNKGSLNAKSGDSEDNDRPKSFKETLEKLRIEREKKDFDEMIDRGEEALKLSGELEKAFERNGRLTSNEVSKLASVEKLVKKIRSELGGGDDDEGEEDKNPPFAIRSERLSPSDAIKSFRVTTIRLFDELKKTTRFTISAAAIQSSNAVLKIARLLRISN